MEPDPEARLNAAEEDKPYYVPVGPVRGKFTPENPAYTPKELKPEVPGGSGNAQAPLTFEDYDETDAASPIALVPGH